MAVKKAKAKKVFCKVCTDWEIKKPERCSNTLKKASGTLYFCTKRCKEKYLNK
ncbi:hypothetical protein K2P97_09465 [bacterium]|nr:hypothetical protein [bacterium]